MYVWCVAAWFLFCIFQDPPESVVYFSPSGVQFTEASVEQGLLPLKSLKVAAFGSVFLIVNRCQHCFHQHFLSSIACSLHCPMVVFNINPLQFIFNHMTQFVMNTETDRQRCCNQGSDVGQNARALFRASSLPIGQFRWVNSLDFCPASLKSLGCFCFRCVLASQCKAVTVNLQILHGQP